jgi:hypothetical protein
MDDATAMNKQIDDEIMNLCVQGIDFPDSYGKFIDIILLVHYKCHKCLKIKLHTLNFSFYAFHIGFIIIILTTCITFLQNPLFVVI